MEKIDEDEENSNPPTNPLQHPNYFRVTGMCITEIYHTPILRVRNDVGCIFAFMSHVFAVCVLMSGFHYKNLGLYCIHISGLHVIRRILISR